MGANVDFSVAKRILIFPYYYLQLLPLVDTSEARFFQKTCNKPLRKLIGGPPLCNLVR